MKLLLILMFVVQGAGIAYQGPTSSRVRPIPLQKNKIVLNSPTSFAKRILSFDEKTGVPIEYDPKPRVEVVDARSGKYALQWIGYDGKEKTVVYQRPDMIDAIVTASISKTRSGRYLYIYKIQNLPSSGQQLAGFAVQNLASDVKPEEIENVFVGPMSNNKVMKEGNWLRFGILSSFTPLINAGQNIEFRLESSAPAGLVECRIHGGVLGMKGVGEHMPQELEDVLPGYEAWPSGFTIGPIDKLKTLSPAERANYLLKLLPKFKELGWMTADALHWYEQNLNRMDIATISQHAEQDLGAGNITNEVLVMIQGIR